MRGLRSTIVLLVVLIGLGAYIYFVTWKQPDTAASSTKTAGKVFDVASDKIDEIRISTASGEAATVKKDGSSWKVTDPIQAAADDSEVSGITSALSSAEMVRVVDENPTNLNDYGLSNPRIEVDFKTAGAANAQKLFIGEKTPTGADVFARRNDDKKVFLIAAFQETSLNKTPFDLRDKSILKFDREKVDGIEVAAAGKTIDIAKDGGDWKLKKPVDVRADFGTVEGLVGRLQTVRMKSIANDSPTPADLKKYGLDKPETSVSLNAGSARATLLLGGKADDATVYARDSSKPMVMTVESSLVDDLKKPADDYRRKDLFEFRAYNAQHVEITRDGKTFVFDRVKSTDDKNPDKWHEASPSAKDVDKDKFDALLAKLANMRADKFAESTANTGLDKPALTISVKFDEKQEKVSFGQSGSDVYASVPGGSGAAKTDAADFNESLKSLDEITK